MNPPNCLDCKHMGAVSRDDNDHCQVLLFCKAIELNDGSHPICGVERNAVTGKCGADGSLFEPR